MENWNLSAFDGSVSSLEVAIVGHRWSWTWNSSMIMHPYLPQHLLIFWFKYARLVLLYGAVRE